MNYNTFSTADIEPAAQQPHGNWEDVDACMWICKLGNMNADTENAVQTTKIHNHRKKTAPHKVLAKLCEVVGADIFMITNEHLLSIVDYYSNFPAVKNVESISAEDLIWETKVVFTEFGLSQKLVPDAGTNFVWDQFKEFCRNLNIDQVVTSSRATDRWRYA